jgi:hypothetical protein
LSCQGRVEVGKHVSREHLDQDVVVSTIKNTHGLVSK